MYIGLHTVAFLQDYAIFCCHIVIGTHVTSSFGRQHKLFFNSFYHGTLLLLVARSNMLQSTEGANYVCRRQRCDFLIGWQVNIKLHHITKIMKILINNCVYHTLLEFIVFLKNTERIEQIVLYIMSDYKYAKIYI